MANVDAGLIMARQLNEMAKALTEQMQPVFAALITRAERAGRAMLEETRPVFDALANYPALGSDEARWRPGDPVL